jgi:succinate dehydrogenase / fumarate reductase flavoprotein subunit
LAILEDLGEVVSTDVLIIGGGIGGITTAIKVKEESPNASVLIVEKQTTGWSGKATKIGGFLAFLAPENNADKFIDFQVRNTGIYLNDQELLTSYVRDSYQALIQLGEWGVRIAKDKEGKIATMKAFWAPDWTVGFIDIDMMLPLRTRARKLGTKILDKIHVVDLLKKDGAVIGAVGFNIVNGRFYIFKAKATVLANGSCNYKVRRFWAAGCGDGIAAAYRVGAEMRNAEFGNLYGHLVFSDTDAGNIGSDFLVNASGESIVKKYWPNMGPTGVFLPVKLAVGMEKEVVEGRGPILFEPPPSSPSMQMGTALPKLGDWRSRMEAKERKYGMPPAAKREVAVPLHGELSCIKVDHDMKTSLDGLFAIGDASYAGSAVAGAVASPPGITPGSGIGYAVISAGWCGPAAARYAAGSKPTEVSNTEVKRLKEEIFAPMQRRNGLSPWEIIAALQDVTAPMKYNLRRNKERLEEAVSKVEEVKEKLPGLWAKDGHYLSKCHEIKSMAICAEITFRAALMRTESRGFQFREDYPERDDKNWLKWIVCKQEGEKVAFSTKPVPIETYKVKP